jgi:hypothetical protein
MTDELISPLRRRMIEDMSLRHFAEKTQNTTSAQSRPSRFSLADRPTR